MISMNVPSPADGWLNSWRQQVMTDTDCTTQWMVIAHHDGKLIDRVRRALEPASPLVLAIRQDQWNLYSEEMADAIRLAIREVKIRGVLLCGHSLRGVPWPVECDTALAGRATTPSGAHHILGGIQRSRSRLKAAQRHFASHFDRLAKLEWVAESTSVGQLELQGVFYLAESGTFQRFDPESGGFEPLLANAYCI